MEVAVLLSLLLIGWVLIVFVRNEIALTNTDKGRKLLEKEAHEQKKIEDEFGIIE